MLSGAGVAVAVGMGVGDGCKVAVGGICVGVSCGGSAVGEGCGVGVAAASRPGKEQLINRIGSIARLAVMIGFLKGLSGRLFIILNFSWSFI